MESPRVYCKDCWANLASEVEIIVDWDESAIIMNEFTAQLVGEIAYNFELVTELGWRNVDGSKYEIASYEPPDLSVLGMLTIESLCTLNVELQTTGATFVQCSLSSNLDSSASIGAQYIRVDPVSPGTWDWVNNVTWSDEPVNYEQQVLDDSGAISNKATVETTLDIRLAITAGLSLYGWVGLEALADLAIRPR